MPAGPVLLIADPADNRVAFFQAALARQGLAPAEMLAYADVIARPGLVAERAPRGGVVRIESPGRDFGVYRALLRRGAADALADGGPALSPEQVDALEQDKGRILYPRQWYLGLCAALADVRAALGPDMLVTPEPGAIAVMTDKRRCHALLRDAGLPVPPALRPVSGFDDLAAAMADAGMARVFVKLRYGSAASGIIALAMCGGRVQAYTTVEVPGGDAARLYNTRRIRHLTCLDEVRPLVDALCRHGAHVERWVPKAAIGGRACDLRVVMIDGEPAHTVLRLSRTPITNLHLGNTRADAALLHQRMPGDAWAALEDTCRRIAAGFAHPLQVAADIAVSPDYRRHYVLEVNAFGDLLKGVLCDGLDTYDLQARALAAGWAHDDTHAFCGFLRSG